MQPDDFPHGVGGDAERVLRGEVPRGVGEGAVDRRADRVGAGGGRVPSDEPEPVVEGVAPFVSVLVVPVGAPDGREFPEERHDALRMVPGVALGFPWLAVLRGDGGPELGDLVHGNGERVVLPSACVLEIVVDGGRPVLPGASVGRDRALDGGRERGDLGEDFGAGARLFR